MAGMRFESEDTSATTRRYKMKRFNKIINGFNKTIKNLDDLNTDNGVKVDDINVKVANLTFKKFEYEEEAKAAATVSKKLKALIGE